MFPHVITIYRHSVENGADKYRRQTVRDVYWYGRRGVTISGKGLQAANFVTVVSSPEQAAAFGTSWNVILGDRLIRGEGSDITSWKDLKNSVTVIRIEDNRCGGSVDNITLECE